MAKDKNNDLMILRRIIDDIVVDAFNRINYAYRHHREGFKSNDVKPKEKEIKTRLTFPRYFDVKNQKKNSSGAENNNGEVRTRISEQELRFAFVEAFNAYYCEEKDRQKNKYDLYYSIETPTEKKYKGFSSGEPKQDIDGRSGEFDLVIFKKENNELKRICLIEFKAHNADEKDYWKDILKLNEEKQDNIGQEALCYFINIFPSYDKGTINSIRAKYHRFFIENRKDYYQIDNVCIWWYALESPNKKHGEVMNEEFMMSNLHQEDTGIDAVIYVTHKWPKYNPFVIAWNSKNNKVSLSIEDEPKVLEPDKQPDDISDVIEWIRINKDVLLDYWNDDLYPTSKMLSEIKRIKSDKKQ